MTMFRLRDEMSKETENVVNRLHRHCRIGRVEKKMQTLDGWVKPPRSIFADQIKYKPTPFFSGGYVHTDSAAQVVINPVHGVMI